MAEGKVTLIETIIDKEVLMTTNIRDPLMTDKVVVTNKIEAISIEEIEMIMVLIKVATTGIRTTHIIEAEVEIETSTGVQVMIREVAVISIEEVVMTVEVIKETITIEEIITRGKEATLITKEVQLGKITSKEEKDLNLPEIIKEAAIFIKEDKIRRMIGPTTIGEMIEVVTTITETTEVVITIKEETIMAAEMIIEVVLEAATEAVSEEVVAVLIEADSVVVEEAEAVEAAAEVTLMMRCPRRATTTKVR